MTHTARRILAATTAAGLGLGLLGAIASPASAVASCVTDCIGTVTPSVTPDGATLTFSTSTPARVKVTVSPYGFAGGSATLSSTGSSHTVPTGQLAQGSNYRYVVVASDDNGFTWQETGYFTTLTRTLSLDWGVITVADDSDWSGAGEIGADGVLQHSGAVCQHKALSPFPNTGSTFRSTSSGTTLTIDAAADLTCAKVPATSEVGIYMIDNDVDPGDTCSVGPDNPFPYFGSVIAGQSDSSECWDWTTGRTSLTFPQTGAATGTQTSYFSVSSVSGGVPAFAANGNATFTVTKPAASLPATTTGPVAGTLTLDGAQNPITGEMPQIRATWTTPSVPNQTLTAVKVQIRKAGGAWSEILTLPLATTTAAFNSLAPGGQYEVVVLGLDNAGQTYARTSALTIAQSAPGAPTALTATAGDGTVNLAWQPGVDNGAPITAYRVRYFKAGEQLATVLDFAPGTTRTVTGLANGIVHTFYVDSENANGMGASAMAQATPVAPPAAPEPPAAPLPPAQDPAAPVPAAPGQVAGGPQVAPQVTLATGRKKDGRVTMAVSGYTPQVASLVITWCDTRISGKACDPTTARKHGTSSTLTADGTLALKLTKKSGATFQGGRIPATFGGIKAKRADRIRVQVRTTWQSGLVETSAISTVRL